MLHYSLPFQLPISFSLRAPRWPPFFFVSSRQRTMNGGGDTRVSLPTDVRKAVQEVKKTLGSKYSDEFVHTILKDCGMDPNEAGRRLKLIHDIREIAGKHSVEDVYTMLKDCNMDPNEAAQRLLYIDTFHEVKKKQDRRKPINGDTSEEFKRTWGNQWRGAKDGRGTFYASKVFDDAGGGRSLSSGKEYGVKNRLERLSRQVQTRKEDNMVNSGADANGTLAISNGSTDGHKLAPESLTVVLPDVSSSTSDPIVVSSHNTPHICAVGTIKCEIVKRSSTSNARIPAGRRKFSADQVGGGTDPVVADSDNIRPPKSDVEKNQASESLQPHLLPTQKNTSDVVNPNQDNEPPKVAAFEKLTTPISLTNPEEESELKVLAPKLDVMVEKLTISSHHPVIFPDHVQVPEIYRSRLTFGSLDVNTDDDSKPLFVTESSKLDGEDVTLTLPSLSNENVSTTAQEGELQDNPLPESVLPSQDNNSSDSAIKHDDTKPEIIPATVGFQNSVLQNTRDYSFGFMPQLMGPHFVQLDIPDVQSGSSPVASTLSPTSVTQPAIAAQSSIALSPPLFPYFRPYANYIPYNPYFPHMYLPQHAHLLNHGHGVFPQPSPHTGNVHMQAAAAAAAAAGGKFPTTLQNKQGGDEDIPVSQAKENNNHSTVQQGEDPEVWAPAAGLDVPNLLPHYFYNFPQGHHMAYSPLQAAFYHSSQTMTAQSTVQPLLYQSQATGGTVEPMVQPPPTSHHAPHINRNNTALLNGDTS